MYLIIHVLSRLLYLLDMSISFGMSEFIYLFPNVLITYRTFPTYLTKLMICHNTIQLKQTFKVKNFYPSYRIQANSTVWQFFTHFWHVKVLSVNIAKGIYLGGLFSSPRKVAIVRGNFGKQNGVIRDRL